MLVVLGGEGSMWHWRCGCPMLMVLTAALSSLPAGIYVMPWARNVSCDAMSAASILGL